ncbi:hypothetical protein [Cellulomonas sp.]|uniref:hypothetical protein n=1 Tax=Cellulomonas sp. TaxID=40001 RepID=UPI003BABEAA4
MSTDKTPRDDDETLALPVTGTEPGADDTAVIPVEETATDEDPSVLALDETTPLPVTQPAPFGSPEPPAATSPIGALYSPSERPAPADVPSSSPDPFVAATAPSEPAPVDPPRRRLRVGTVVWGLVIAAIGVGLLAWAAGVEIDLQLAMIVLLAVAGTALLVGSIVSGARNARR